MRQTSRPDCDGERRCDDHVNPTARWLVHGVWRTAVATIIILLVLNLVFELTD
jgi:hypothetical protein